MRADLIGDAAPGAASSLDDSLERAQQFWPSAGALGLGGFAIGTGEFMAMGLLPHMATDMHVSIPRAANLISAYALGVVVGAPMLAILCANWNRRTLLLAMIAAFALFNFASALCSGYRSLLVARFVTGLPHATYFGVAALVAVGLAPKHRRASAVGVVMLGLTGAALFGVPLATWMGQRWGWRLSFGFVGGIACVASAIIYKRVPATRAAPGSLSARQLGALARPRVWLTLVVAAVGFGSLFAVLTYIEPLVTTVTGLSAKTVPLMLAFVGVGMVAGNVIGSRLADKSVLKSIAGLLIWAAIVSLSIMYTSPYPVAMGVNVVALGTIVALAPAIQIRLMDVAGDAQILAAALMHSAFNLANALGAWLGGSAIADGLGWTSVGWVGATLSMLGLVVFLVSIRTGINPLGVKT